MGAHSLGQVHHSEHCFFYTIKRRKRDTEQKGNKSSPVSLRFKNVSIWTRPGGGLYFVRGDSSLPCHVSVASLEKWLRWALALSQALKWKGCVTQGVSAPTGTLERVLRKRPGLCRARRPGPQKGTARPEGQGRAKFQSDRSKKTPGSPEYYTACF